MFGCGNVRSVCSRYEAFVLHFDLMLGDVCVTEGCGTFRFVIGWKIPVISFIPCIFYITGASLCNKISVKLL
jgi:hypothetical protein